MTPLEYKGHHTKSDSISQSTGPLCWDVVVVGDAPRVHNWANALDGLLFTGLPVRCRHAPSCPDAKTILSQVPDTAVVLLDITDGDGPALVKWIRNTRNEIQIGVQIHNLDPVKTIEDWDINDIIPQKAGIRHLRALVLKALVTFNRQTDLKARLKRWRAKAALGETESRLHDLIWQTDSTGNFTFVYANSRTGLTPEKLNGRPYETAMTRDCRKNTWPELKKQMGRNEPFTNVKISRCHNKNQTRYYLTSGIPVFSGSGRPMGYKGVDKDITELVRSEIEKKNLIAQRNAQRLEALGTLAGGIAHDFNNILGGILGYAQLLQFEIKNNPTALSHTGHIVSGCDRAKNLIHQILDFSRQREAIAPETPVTPVKIVEETLKLFTASIPSSIQIKTDIRQDAGHILADPSQIHQAVMNLCTNARQAIETGMGQITIRVAPVKLTPENHTRSPALDLDFGDYVIICIADTGKGIEPDISDKIFNPYFTTKQQGDGTGLGLSVVHGIVTLFNGVISVDTSPETGTAFTLFFPQYRSKKQCEPKPAGTLIQGKASVLFIDDEPMLVDIGKMMLEKLGYRVMATRAPLAGIDAVKKEPHRFDVVITDMTMPDIHGINLARKIKKISPGIQIILATGFSNIVETQDAALPGIDAVLPKPITMDSLSSTLHKLLYA